jgi:glycosyltransferase involved in cell wall biosynthesis
MNNKIRLSQCMIVKNEEENIRRALTWGKDIMYEQIVVDTGSTDRTVEIAEEMGAKVFHFTWINDFSAAKNFAIEQATGSWIAFLDADEYFSPEDTRKLLPLIARLDKITPLTQRPAIVRTSLANLNDSGGVDSVMSHDRIFRNMSQIRYLNKVHEYLDERGLNGRVFDARDRLTIFHTGYTKEAFDGKNKMERNLAILEQVVKDEPENYDAWFYLGNSYFGKGQYELAEEVYYRVLDHIEEVDGKEIIELFFCNFLNLKYEKVIRNENWKLVDREEEILNIYNRSIEYACPSPDTELWVGKWMFAKDQKQDGINCFELALKKLENYTENGLLVISGELPKVYRTLFEAYLSINKPQEAVRYATLYLRMEPFGKEVLIRLLQLFGNVGGDKKMAEASLGFLSKLYDFTRSRDKFFLVEISREAFFKELESKVFELLTQEEIEFLQGKGKR